MTVGSVVGAALGAQVALSMSEERLRMVYMASLVVLGGRSFVAAARNCSNLAKKYRIKPS